MAYSTTNKFILTAAFLFGGLLLFSSCKKKDSEVVPVFPDRPVVNIESANEENGNSNSNSTANGSNNESASGNSENSERDQTGSLPEFHQIPHEASIAESIPELPNVTFALNSDEMTDEMKLVVQRHIDFLKDHTALFVVLRGHTDEQGTDEYNYSLGQRRATTVRDYLITQGIESTRLSTLSYGEDYPLIESDDQESYSQNRRVEFLVYEVTN